MTIFRFAKHCFWAVLVILGAAHLAILSQTFLPAPQTLTMTQRVVAGESLLRQNVAIEDISPYLIAAVIAAEDARFCGHHGIDFEAIEKAIEHNKKGGRRRGGSTITQQTAKNLFLWNGGGFIRKAGEAYIALFIDATWSKTRIMEHYLNIAEWGDGIFGAEAAAQARFGKSASALTAYEAALLASVLPSPNKWRIDPPSEYVTGRARTINARLKVTAREGFGDCVLKNHPAFMRANFEVSRPGVSDETKQPDTGPSIAPDDKITPADENALEEVLASAELAAQAARADKTKASHSERTLAERSDDESSAAVPDATVDE